MPFKSKAQQRFMFAAEERGEVPEGTAERWAKHTPDIKKLPEKKHKDKHEKKAEFIEAFISSFYTKLGMSKEAAAKTPIADILNKLSECDLEKAASAQPGPQVPPNVGEALGAVTSAGKAIGSALADKPSLMHDIALGVGAPFVLGGLGGAGLARLFSPSQYEISNLQKQELVAQYDSAIKELTRRIATRAQ